jgi:hypothetical protein
LDEEILTTKTFFVAAILATGIFAISQMPSNAAMVMETIMVTTRYQVV